MNFLGACEEQGKDGMCPICSSGPVKEGDLLEVVVKEPGEEESKPRVMIRKNDFVSSTKIDALIRNLRKYPTSLLKPYSNVRMVIPGRIRDQDPHFRAVVFSQFTTFLDILQIALTRESLFYTRFDGTMDLKKRHAAINTFKDPNGPDGRPRPMVLLISLKAGGVGLNLTNANYAFMVSVAPFHHASCVGSLCLLTGRWNFSDGLLVECCCRKSRSVSAVAFFVRSDPFTFQPLTGYTESRRNGRSTLNISS